jgi:hypothetical protein
MLKYFIINIEKKEILFIWNILHRAVINKNKEIIKFIPRYDSDKNELKEKKIQKEKYHQIMIE